MFGDNYHHCNDAPRKLYGAYGIDTTDGNIKSSLIAPWTLHNNFYFMASIAQTIILANIIFA